MRTLAFDATSDRLTVVLHDGETPTARFVSSEARRHAETILVAIDRVLSDGGVTLSDVDLVAVGLGPGSYTGIRIGLATAQGLTFGGHPKLVGLSSLATMAGADEGFVVVALDARGGRLFTAAFSGDRRLADDRQTTVDELVAHWHEAPWAGAPLRLVGSGAPLVIAALTADAKALVRDVDGARRPSADRLAVLGRARLNAEGADDPADLRPVYAAVTQAERLRR